MEISLNSPYSTDAPTSPLRALAERWYWGLGLGVLGLALGAGASLLSPVAYVGEARVAVGSQSLDARVVAGYSIASQQLASDLSRYVNDQQEQGQLRTTLGPDAAAVQLVQASPIPESSVIRVEVTAADPDVAAKGAQAVASNLAKEVNGLTDTGPADLLTQYTAISQQVAQQQTALQAAQSDLGAARTGRTTTPEAVAAAEQRVTDAQSALAVAEVQQSALGEKYQNAVNNTPAAAGLDVISPGTVTSDDRQSEASRYGIAGLGLGLVAALVLATWADRRRSRRRAQAGSTEDERPSSASSVNVREHAANP